MFKKFLTAALACAVFGTVSLTSFAESGEKTVQSEESAPKIEYIHSEITEKRVNSSIYEEIIANQIVFYSNIPSLLTFPIP